MLTSLESRLWLAVHLLYPNSSQAFDVYQAIVAQSESAITQENKIFVFSKLVSVFEKIPAISSNLSFYEFEFDQIDQWKIIYKSSQKIQLLIFVGVLIFELKISEIALIVKLSQEKAQFLFHQIFKKLAQSSAKIKYNEQLNFKKHNDFKISYLYTYENLIEYCLSQLPAEESEKVKIGLELYPILQVTRDEYLKIINQIQNLKVQKSNSVSIKSKLSLVTEAKPQAAAAELSESSPTPDEASKNSIFKNKKIMAASFTTLILATAIFFQMSGIAGHLIQTDGSVVIQQVAKKQELAVSKDEIALGSLPSPNENVPPQEAEVSVVSADVSAPPVVSIAEVEAKPEPKKTESIAEPEVKKEEKAEGGLYRGTLTVSDLQNTNKKLLQKIKALGAKKAGEVELGWMKTNKMAYYHYTIPEKNMESAAQYFKEVGSLEIKFESHPRVIPAGSKRFIIEIKGI
ncbi:MAG: hypothetical protein ABL930_01550 [Pseudobdellovibrio sp.]